MMNLRSPGTGNGKESIKEKSILKKKGPKSVGENSDILEKERIWTT